MAEHKPKVVVFGGCGFIGREIVRMLVADDVASLVVAVDKVPPQLAFLGSRHQQAFDDPRVVFRSANLINARSVEAVFADEAFDWAINAAAETKFGLSSEVYEEGITRLSRNCAVAAASASTLKVFLEVSDGTVYASDKSPNKECGPCKPHSVRGACKLRAEQHLKQVDGLRWVVVRPALVYGPGAKQGLTGRLVVAAVYRQLQESMKLLWSASTPCNTVHVSDLARAIVFLCQHGRASEVYNVVDEAATTQGAVTHLIADIFDVEVGYYGTAASTLAKLDLENNVAEVNAKHLPPWAALCQSPSGGGAPDTPLSPYLDADAMMGGGSSLDGSKLKEEGFMCRVLAPTRENVMEVLQELVALRLFPAVALPPPS